MKPDPLRPLRGTSLSRDLAVATATAALVAAVAAAMEFSERLFAWTRGFERYQLDEWPTALLAFAVAMVVLYARRHAELRRVLEENRRLMARLLDVQEEERRRLARELHDELGQTLNAIKLDAITLQQEQTHSRATEIARRIATNTDAVYAAAGDLIRQLRPPALDDLGLVDALEACVDRWRASHPALSVHLSTDGELGDLGETLNLSLYRMVQEGLTNCVRHAGARNMHIGLSRDSAAGRIRLEMRDDGRGLDKGRISGGSGLNGMRERIALLHGRFEVISQPGEGTNIRAVIPDIRGSNG